MLSENVIAEVSAIRARGAMLDMADKRVVIANLVFVHQLITASESLLVEAAKRATGDLKRYYREHWTEERGHEAWLAKDLKTAGVDVKTIWPLRRAVEMAGAQYYLVRHVSPACLLGYMAVLEGSPMPLANIGLLEEIHGKPLLRTLRYHAEHDIEHRKEVFRMIDANPHPLTLDNAVHTALGINEFAKEIS